MKMSWLGAVPFPAEDDLHPEKSPDAGAGEGLYKLGS